MGCVKLGRFPNIRLVASLLPAGLVFGLIFFHGLGLTGFPGANGFEDLFAQGNRFYESGEFQEALKAYQAILESGAESGPLYFNMGNCYYKLGRIGQSILFYERAARLIPGDDDLQANLELANLRVVDKITPLPEFWLVALTRWAVYLLPRKALVGLLFFGYWIFMASLLFRVLVRKRLLIRSVASRTTLISGLLLILIGLPLMGQLWFESGRVEAVILAGEVEAESAPGAGAVEVFTIHEGTKVRIGQTSENWLEIILADGNVGWVRSDVLEVI